MSTEAESNVDRLFRSASAHHRDGRLTEAEAAYRKVLAANGQHSAALHNLGAIAVQAGRPAEAIGLFEQVLRVNPDHAGAHFRLGSVFQGEGRLDDAVAAYREAVRIEPARFVAHNDLGNGLKEQGRLEHAVASFRQALRIRPETDIAYTCYSDRSPDALTERLKTASNAWADTRGISDQALSDRIRSDGIDILFDLAGHTARNRLLVFARKPAPVQITWMGYVGTTGLGAMDYLMADNRHVPAGADRFYSEQVMRLPDGYICYDPPAYAPSVGPSPLRRNGFVSFGCFCNPAKINRHVAAAWAEILRRLPNSRLVLKYKNINSDSNRNRLNELFAAHGTEPSRLILEGKSLHNELLARYNEIDIALDTFPYSGGLTTCEALWMGVPVVTVPGETFASRHSLSHLSNVGLAELAARDVSHFVELAVELANDPSRLAALRAGLRNRMAKSALCDGPKFARHFASAMRNAWREWCSGRAI